MRETSAKDRDEVRGILANDKNRYYARSQIENTIGPKKSFFQIDQRMDVFQA
jgi:hypothetical protein